MSVKSDYIKLQSDSRYRRNIMPDWWNPKKNYCSFSPDYFERLFSDLCCEHDYHYIYRDVWKIYADFVWWKKITLRHWTGFCFGLIAQLYLWTWGIYAWYRKEKTLINKCNNARRILFK